MKMVVIIVLVFGCIDYYVQSLYFSIIILVVFKRGIGEILFGFFFQYEGERVWIGFKWLDFNFEKSYIVQIDKDDLFEVENVFCYF